MEEKVIKMAPQPPKGRCSGCGHLGGRKPGGPRSFSGALEGYMSPSKAVLRLTAELSRRAPQPYLNALAGQAQSVA